MAIKKKVAVIGAGVSGLAAAKAFKEKGHDVTILERSHDLGGVWELSRSYPDVQTQSPKDLYRYTDKPMSAAYPEWPKGPQVHAYLSEYCDEHGLRGNISFNTDVQEMRRRSGEQRGWTLTLSRGGKAATEDFDFVAACTGQFSDKNAPTFPGQAEFTSAGGQIIHSSDYTDPAMVKGKNVVVLGFSKSATDIAVYAAKSGAKSVTIVYRESVWRVPYFIGGLINFKRILYIRKQEQMFPGWQQSSLERIGLALGKPLIWANWRALESLLSIQLKFRKTGLRPKTRIEDGVNCSVPIVTPGFYDLVADGRIKAIQGSFKNYEPGAVALTGGRKVSVDLAVLATGWRLGVPYLPKEYQSKLVEPDGQYKLYRLIVNPDIPDMGFVGFNSSFCTILSSELAANWLVRFADGKLARQPSAADMQQNIAAMLHWRRVERPAASVYGGLCVAPYHFRHFDELLADMGAATKRRNPIAENFSPPNADAYGRFLRTTPQYMAQ